MLHRTQCRIVRQTVGIVHILIAGETSKHCLAEKPPVSKCRVFLPAAAFRERQTRQIGRPEGIVQFVVRKQPSAELVGLHETSASGGG
jgi:hypothetical protein